jgi:hypothetical protein
VNVTGRCQCGQITYEATVDPEQVGICHCTDCRRLSGAPYRVRLPVPIEDFKLLSGSPKTYLKTGDSGARRMHAFCGECGSPVYACAPESPTSITLRVCCLDNPADLPPKKQIWCRSALPWAGLLDALPGLDRQ